MSSQLEQLLTCCICLDRFRNPKLLPCQHSVCMEPCMEGLVDYVRRQVKCPECRAEHRIPYNGVQGFPSNVTLQRFLEAHIEITGETPDPFTGQVMERCGVCNEKNYLSTCAHCEKKICTDCKAAHNDILKREIGRINNQVKRASHRLGDQLSVVDRSIHGLKQNSDSVKEEIENISKRLQKAIRDRCEALKNEVISYYNTEHKNLTQLKEGLEQEMSNVESNCDLAEKHMDDQTPWDDNELMDAKDIFLKTMEFIRGFDFDAGDYNRRVRFNVPDDINKLASTLASLGDLIINTPKQLNEGYNSGGSGGLMKSKSDHRLAAQFRDQEESYGYSGRTSPLARRRFGERPHVAEEPSYESPNDIGRRRFRSRFIRREEEEDRPMRYNEEEPQQQKIRPKVIDTEDVSRGPLSGITRMADSPRVIQRLQEKEGKFVRKKKEEPPKPVVPQTPKVPTFGTPRKTARQVSEDEIDKIKKQNKTETSGASSNQSTTTTTTTTTKPSLERLSSLKDTERSSRSDRQSSSPRSGTLSPAASEEESNRRSSRDHGTNRFDFSSTNKQSQSSSNRTSTDNGAFSKAPSYSRSSSTSSVGESGKSSTTKTQKSGDTNSYEHAASRSNSTDSNRSVESSSRTSATSVKTPSTENKSSTSSSRGSGASRYQSRFMPRAGTPSAESTKDLLNDEDDDEESTDDSETEESEESSEEEEEEEKDTIKTNYARPSTSILLGKSSAVSREPYTTSNDSGYGSSGNSSSRYGNTPNSSDSSSSYRRSSYLDSTKTPKETSEEIESKYPYASKFLNRSRTSTANTEEETKPSFQSRFLSKSKSSALLGPDANNEDDSHIPSGTGTSRAKFEELKERRQRLARSKSSAGLEDDDSPSTSETTSPLRNRYGRDSDTSSSVLGTTRSSNTSAGASSLGSEDAPANQLSNWARYLKNKYGNKTGTSSTSAGGATAASSTSSTSGTSGLLGSKSSLARSRSSHLLGLAKENDSSEDDSKNVHATPTSQVAGTLGPTPFGNIHRSQYLHKQRLLFKIGSRGSEPANFTWPRGIAIGPDDSIVVADSSNHRVQVFDSEGNYVKDFGSYGNGEGEFDCLAGIAVNRIGQYIIADRYNHRIQIFDPSGMFLRSFGSQGSSDGKFCYPWGVTTDSLGFIYVCDKENHRIQVFQSDGTFVGKFGSLGNKCGQLEHPHYIAVSSTNRVIVSDSNNHRIQIFDINGKVMKAFGTEGNEEGQFKFPRGVAVDEQGYIFVADSGNNRIQIFHPDGAFLRAFGCWGSGDGEFKGLEGVGVMSNGNILICDRENHRVQVF